MNLKIYLQEPKDYEKIVKRLRGILLRYIVENRLKSLVMGISGGIDSALVAAIVKPICDIAKIPFIGRSITIESNKKVEIQRADSIGHYFCTNFAERDLTDNFEKLAEINTFDEGDIGTDWNDHVGNKIRLGNIKARIRMIYLYHLAGESKGMVLSTDNFTEYLLGFWTIHGDVGDFGLIQNLWKTEVYNLAEWIAKNELEKDAAKALMDCVEADATDGLGITNSDLDQILPGFQGSSREGYLEVDNRLKGLVKGNYQNYNESDPVISRWVRTQFKRNNPLNIVRYLLI